MQYKDSPDQMEIILNFRNDDDSHNGGTGHAFSPKFPLLPNDDSGYGSPSQAIPFKRAKPPFYLKERHKKKKHHHGNKDHHHHSSSNLSPLIVYNNNGLPLLRSGGGMQLIQVPQVSYGPRVALGNPASNPYLVLLGKRR